MHRQEVQRQLADHLDTLHDYGVRSLRLFGSTARGEADASSDVDLLVDFAEPPTFARFMDLRFFLEDLLGTRVDLVTEAGLRQRIRPFVERDAVRVA